MNTVFRYCIAVTALLILISCGHRKAPTGGKVDTEKPEVVSITPEPFSDLGELLIEITFSKPIDRSSVYSGEQGLYIYPLISDKKYRWRDNTLRIEINEPLQEDSNYYLSLSRSIRDLRNNELDKDYLYIFHTGRLSNNRIGGEIIFEKEEDSSKEITITVMAPDSVRIFTKKIFGSRYNIEYLDERDHIIRAFIDLNNNRRYDVGREPFYQAYVSKNRYSAANLHLEYFDETKPELRGAVAPYNNRLMLTMSKPVTELGKITITSIDSLRQELDILGYDFLDNRIEVITAEMDSVRYSVKLMSVRDAKNNVADSLIIDFEPSLRKDTEPLRIVEHFPRDGAVVETVNPALRVNFSKHIFPEDIKYSVIDTMTRKEVQFNILKLNSRNFLFVPEKFLAGRQIYRLIIHKETKDAGGANLEEDFELNFLPIAE